MRKIVLFCYFCCYMFLVSAQTETTDWKYQLEIAYPLQETQVYLDPQGMMSVLKMTNIHRFEEDYYMLGYTLRKSIEDDQLKVYDKNNKPYRKSAIPSILNETAIDTIIIFNEDTWEEQIQIIENKNLLFPTENTVYQFTQNWNFDNKSQKLSNDISSINIFNGFEREGNERFLFSIKNKSIEKTIESQKMMEKSSVIWAKSIYYVGEFDNIKLREKLLSTAHLSKNKVVSHATESTPLTMDDIAFYLEGSVDTLMDFKPDDPDPQATVIKGENLTAKDITHFKILQDIYFDVATHSFVSRIVAIAPCKIEYDDYASEHMYVSTLFWIVYDDDFFKY